MRNYKSRNPFPCPFRAFTTVNASEIIPDNILVGSLPKQDLLMQPTIFLSGIFFTKTFIFS